MFIGAECNSGSKTTSTVSYHLTLSFDYAQYRPHRLSSTHLGSFSPTRESPTPLGGKAGM